MYIIDHIILYDPYVGKLIGLGLWFPEGAQRQLPIGRRSSTKSKAMLRCAVSASARVTSEKMNGSITDQDTGEEALRQENAALRHKVKLQFENLDEMGLLKPFLAEHEKIVLLGAKLGEGIPSFVNSRADAKPDGCEDGENAHEVDESMNEPIRDDSTKTYARIQGVEIQVESDDTLVFKFQSPSVSNNSLASSLASSYGGRKNVAGRTSGANKSTIKATKSKEELEIEAANAEVENHSPVEVLQDKGEWLFATVPNTLVAGANAVLYFNKSQSGILCNRPHIQVHAKYNHWELDAGESDRIDMVPVDPGVAGAQFYKADLGVIPMEAYEMNFIFSDKEELYDNNNMENYMLQVKGPMTRERWIETAPERAEAEYLKRKEAERRASEAAARMKESQALEEDERRAHEMVDEIKREYGSWSQNAVTAIQNKEGDALWSVTQLETNTGPKIILKYNSKASILNDIVEANSALMLRVGHNGWKDAFDVPLLPGRTGVNEQWWEATIEAPLSAVVLNFVLYSGDHFDNNDGSNYCTIIERGRDLGTWADSILKPLRDIITADRREEEENIKKLTEQKEQKRRSIKEKAEKVRRLQLRHVLYTEPEKPVAGKDLSIHYNPDNTILHGSENVFLTLGFNRWRHPKSYGPLEMEKAGGESSHFVAKVDVPKDAYSIDFVFSDAMKDGRYDNRGGLDYNIPVGNSVVEEPPLYAVHVAVEMAPIAKVGGMGDVVTALGRAVQDLGHNVEVILPRYDFFLQSPLLGGTQYETEFEWGGTRIFVSSCIVEGLRCWFIEPGNGMFATSTVYQGNPDAAKFEFFSRAALEFLLRTQRQPDILHCHDWSTATVARAYWSEYHERGLWKPKIVFTIHNLNYGASLIGEAAYFSQRFTTVSPSYAWEIGGHPAIAANNSKLMGIRNGIDVDIWNPETDQFLPFNYTSKTCKEGKAAARNALRERLGVTGWGDKPMIGVVTRLTKQKGTHLIAHACWRTLDRGGQFILLGSAPDPKVQAEFDGLAQAHGGENAAFCFAFDEPLSHLIYAACDMILVPSMFEPCGLTQMIAMRYGAIPIVRATGGLKDTVFDVDTDKARAAWEMEGSTDWETDGIDATNGFSFEGTDPGALDYALNRAIDAWYNDPEWIRSLQQRVMTQDWSWNKPAIDYIQLYYAAMENK
eukprot:jgi/Picsp_1/2103/NSC_05568-R1_glycosyltransferase family 5 protein